MIKLQVECHETNQREEITVRGRTQTVYDVFGVAMLDYLDLYKWFIPTRQESYKVRFIGELELNQKRMKTHLIHLKSFIQKTFKSLLIIIFKMLKLLTH